MRHSARTARHLGPITIIGLLVAYVALWVVARPQGEPTTAYVGQLVGALSILLLLAVHIPLSSSPIHSTWGAPLGAMGATHQGVRSTDIHREYFDRR